jgi:ribosomal-protein-alanine N-acetyltransferase
MTAVVQRLCQHAFEEFGLVKIIAHVHPHNQASARVLEKCGFQEEGFLPTLRRKTRGLMILSCKAGG